MLELSRGIVCLAIFLALVGCQRAVRCPSRCCPPRCSAPSSAPKPVEVAQKATPTPSTTKAKRSRTFDATSFLAAKRVRGLSWEAINLDQALTYLSTITGLEFKLSPKVREEKFEDIVINAHLDDVDLKTLLEVILTAPFGLHWAEEDGVIWVRTNEEIEGDIRLRYFDVEDIAGSEFTGTPVGEEGPPQARARRTARAKELADEIRRGVAPGYWERDDVTIEGRNGVLIVRASQPIFHQIGAFLARRRVAMKTPALSKKLQSELEATKISLALSNVTVADALKILQVQTGRNMVIDARIEHEVGKAVIANVQAKDISLLTAMNMLKSAAGEGLIWQARGNVLVLVSRKHVHAK